MPFKVTGQCQISRHSSGTPMPSMHYHDNYELYYLEAGSREYFVEDDLFSVAAGDFVLVAPGLLHRTGGEYGMRTLVEFTGDFLRKHFSETMAERLLGCFDRVKITPDEKSQQPMRQLVKELYETEDELDFALRLASLLQRLGKCESTRLEGSTVGAIVSYINHNFGSIRQISQIADHFYISRFHLCRIFKDAMKMTVVDYLNRVRIRNACQYLRSSDKDMGEIAYLCGFHDPAYFSNVFKRQVGLSPSRYRRGE